MTLACLCYKAVSFVEPSFFPFQEILQFFHSLTISLLPFILSCVHILKVFISKATQIKCFLIWSLKKKIGSLLVVSTLSLRVSWGEGSGSERLAMQVWGAEFGFPRPIKLWKQCHGSAIPVSTFPSTLFIIQQNMVWRHRSSLQGTNEYFGHTSMGEQLPAGAQVSPKQL